MGCIDSEAHLNVDKSDTSEGPFLVAHNVSLENRIKLSLKNFHLLLVLYGSNCGHKEVQCPDKCSYKEDPLYQGGTWENVLGLIYNHEWQRPASPVEDGLDWWLSFLVSFSTSEPQFWRILTDLIAHSLFIKIANIVYTVCTSWVLYRKLPDQPASPGYEWRLWPNSLVVARQSPCIAQVFIHRFTFRLFSHIHFCIYSIVFLLYFF